MTDHPRFEPVTCRPEQAHRQHYGGRLVDLVFSVMDRWTLQRPTGRVPRSLKFEVGVPIALALLVISMLAEFGAGRKTARSISASWQSGSNALSEERVAFSERRPRTLHESGIYLP